MSNRKKIIALGVLGFLTGICNGLFGAGGGIIVIPTLVYIMKFENHEAHATALAVILPISIISAIVYYRNGTYAWDTILRVGLGGVVGSVLGSFLLGKLSSHWLRKIFSVFMIIAAIRMII